MGRLDSQEITSKPGFFSALAYPECRRLTIATACTQSAAWALIVLRGALVYKLTESNAWVGFVTMAALLPSLVITPFSGFLADRFDRRKVLAATYIFNLAHNLVLAFLALSGQINQFQILGLAIFNGSIRAVELPTNHALLPNLVPRERLLNAVALNQLVQQGARMTGPLLILPMIRFVDPEPAFFLSAGLYAIAWSQVSGIRTMSKGETEARQGLILNLVAGIRYVYSHGLVLSLVLVTVLHCALTMAFESVFPFFSRAQLGMTTEKDLFQGPTYLMIGVGAGSILGNLALARVEGNGIRGKLFMALGVLSGLTPIALGLAHSIPQAMIAAAAVGAATAGFMTLSHGMIQVIVPDGIRGRVLSANTWHVQGAMSGFNAVNGILMDIPWMSALLLLSGTGLTFVAILVASLLIVQLRTIYTRGIPELSFSSDARTSS